MTSPKEDVTPLLSQSVPEAKTGPLVPHPTRAYQVLPHVAIGDVTSLVELVQTRGSREDLYQLGRHLHIEVDDLLPLVEAADILDLAETQEADLVLIPAGQRFAEAGVLEEKKVFRDQALAHIVILRQIVRSLEAAPGHILPEEYFLSLPEEHFDEDEAQEQLDTTINWGRYAELFTFQDERGVFRLEEPEPAEAA